jgi:hypothetical protein
MATSKLNTALELSYDSLVVDVVVVALAVVVIFKSTSLSVGRVVQSI